jgi:UPF0042 nucleotide-binding protein
MQLVIVSGRSGSGISSALRVLEDSGWTCIDNLPLPLLSNLVNTEIANSGNFAVSIDTRSNVEALKDFRKIHDQLTDQGLTPQILFLNATEAVLLRRFSETRRKHPLSSTDTDLNAAIAKEADLLEPIATLAHKEIDTSSLSLHELRSLVIKQFCDGDGLVMAVQFQSFGFKRGVPSDADLMFDVRCLPNPHWVPELRQYGGNHPKVAQFLAEQPQTGAMLKDISGYLQRWLPEYAGSSRSYLTVAIGCTGGQHRSVYIAEQLAELMAGETAHLSVRHRDLAVPREQK